MKVEPFERYSFESPLGGIEIITSDELLLACNFIPKSESFTENQSLSPFALSVKSALLNYCGRLQSQFNFPIRLEGTDFQQSVWRALQTIPYGEVVSYQWVAEKIGRPKAIRAVGMAIGKNPLSIIIPCHRVIGKNGALRGFAAGLDAKAKLLAIEGR
jgi:methylated-DNA-[protein]-cysteine S-methyltransferase